MKFQLARQRANFRPVRVEIDENIRKKLKTVVVSEQLMRTNDTHEQNILYGCSQRTKNKRDRHLNTFLRLNATEHHHHEVHIIIIVERHSV